MKQAYLDNAATTPLINEVIDEMTDVMKNLFGNPSSTHSFGRKAKNKIETCRKQIATLFGALPQEIVFTANGTESNNLAISSAIKNHQIKHVITSKIEHKAVLETTAVICAKQNIKLSYVNIKQDGSVDYKHLEELLANNKTSLVTLMMANNEIGTILNVKKTGELCKEHKAIFHCDTVQCIGHYDINFEELGIHFATCSAHKFHGPKGIGFLYAYKKMILHPLTHGGGQERGVRPGTEDIIGITGLTKALQIAYKNLEKDAKHVTSIKNYFKDELTNLFKNKISFNGDNKDGLYSVLSVNFPSNSTNEFLLFQLDLNGIAASGGSACSSGSNQGSHVITGIHGNAYDFVTIRFSFSKLTTKKEIDFCLDKLKKLVKNT